MRLLFRYIKNLGLAKGLSNWITVELRRKGKVKPKGMRTRVLLRPGTSDYKVFREIFLFRDYDFELQPPGVIVDAGANVGFTSVFFANKYPEAKIIAIEPDEGNFEMLVKNTEKYDQVKGLKAALVSSQQKFSVSRESKEEWSYQVVPDQSGSVDGITIESILLSEEIDRINLLKIDIEGWEADLFSKNTESWLPKVDAIVIELHDWINPECSRTFFNAISDYPYTVRIYGGMIIAKLI